MLLKRKLCLDKMGINIKQTMPNGQQRSLEVVVASNTGGIGENWIRAYTRAVEIAGRNGCVLSMPKLVQAKIDNPNNGELWGKAINANSEEVVGIDKEGRYSQKNSWVFVEFHGTGLLNPEKLKYAYFHRNAISDADFQSLLAGKLPDGSQVPMYRADQFVRGIQNTSQRYGVVFPIEEITKLGPDLSRPRSLDVLANEPFFIARVGGPEAAAKYIAAVKAHGQSQLLNDHYIRRSMTLKVLQSGHKIFMTSTGGIATTSDILSQGRYIVAPGN